MKDYFTVILASGVAGAVMAVISDGSPLGKYVKYVCALCSVLIIVSPLSSVLKNFSAALPSVSSDISEEAETVLTGLALEETENIISQKIFEVYGIKPISVSINIDNEDRISISVTMEDSSTEKEINEFINKTYLVQQ